MVYYPRVWYSKFMVKAELVEEEILVYRKVGIRVKMAKETTCSSRDGEDE